MSEHIVRQTRQKDAIRDALNGCDEFISAQELHRKLEERGEHIGLATVCAAMTGTIITSSVRTAAKPWKLNRLPKAG